MIGKTSMDELMEPYLKQSQARINELEAKNEKLKQQLKLADEQQDKLYDKLENFRELVTLLLKVW